MMIKEKLHLTQLHHWIDRILISDPGRIRLNRGLKVIFSILTTVGLMALLVHLTGIGQVSDIVLGGAFSMMSIMMVVEQDRNSRILTTFLLPVAASLAITLNAFLGEVGYHLSDLVLIMAIFFAFYLQRFGLRYFSLGMASFFSIYMSSLLHIQFGQLLYLYVALVIGTIIGFLYNFFILETSPKVLLKRTMSDYHRRMNQTFNLIIESVRHQNVDPKRLKRINHNLSMLSEYARMISGQLESAHSNEVWKGVTSRLLRIYVFDTEMLIETLYPAIQRLKYLRGLEKTELRQILIKVIETLRDADVLESYDDLTHLNKAEQAVNNLRQELSKLNSKNKKVRQWLYLIRRIESIANHVIIEAKNLQQIRRNLIETTTELNESDSESINQKENETQNSEGNNQESKGLRFTTKKAIQGSIAGVISIFIGYILSPSHQYWVILTAFLVLLGTESVGRTFEKAIQRTSGTVMGAIIGFGLASLIQPYPFIKIVLLFFCLFMAFYIFIISYSVMVFWITMMVAMMYDLLLGGITPILLGERVMDTFIGAALGLLISVLLFPKRTAKKVNETIEDFLQELNEYLNAYLDSFLGKTLTTNIATKAFGLDEKLQLIRIEAELFTNRPANPERADMQHRVTVMTALNYYAKHLIASSSRNSQLYMNNQFQQVLHHIEACMNENISTLCNLLYSGKGHPTMWKLENDREKIERSPEILNLLSDQKNDFIHDFFYIWEINASLVSLGEELGATIKKGAEREEDHSINR